MKWAREFSLHCGGGDRGHHVKGIGKAGQTFMFIRMSPVCVREKCLSTSSKPMIAAHLFKAIFNVLKIYYHLEMESFMTQKVQIILKIRGVEEPGKEGATAYSLG